MSKKIDLAFDVSDLTEFKNENSGLVQEMFYKPTTIASGIDVMVGEKGTVKLNTLSSDIQLQAASCGWTVSGSTTFGQEEIVVKTMDLKEALCPKDLTSKWMSQLMRTGSNPEELPFENFIVESKVNGIAEVIEKQIWQGDVTSGTGNLALVDGIPAFLDAAEGSVYVASASGTTTEANVLDQIKAIYVAIPEDILEKDDLALFMSPSKFRLLTSALTSNTFDVNNKLSLDGKFYFPNTNLEIIATAGLSSTNFMYASSKSNLVAVTDLTSDAENVEVWYSKDNDEYRLKTTFKAGYGAYFPQYVVHNNPNITI